MERYAGPSRGARSVAIMSPSVTVADCPECRGVNTVIFGTCGFAEFFDDDDDLQPWRDQLPSLVGPPRLATGEDPRQG
jgi:hypothetical protein